MRIQGELLPLLEVFVFISLSSPCSDEHMPCIQKLWIQHPFSFHVIVHVVSYQDDIWRWHFGNSFHGWRQRTNIFQPSQTRPSQFSPIGAPTWCLLHPDHLAIARMVWRNSSWHLCRRRILKISWEMFSPAKSPITTSSWYFPRGSAISFNLINKLVLCFQSICPSIFRAIISEHSTVIVSFNRSKWRWNQIKVQLCKWILCPLDWFWFIIKLWFTNHAWRTFLSFSDARWISFH